MNQTPGVKVGLFGGTFDPIHCGHLNLAFELMEKKQLDQVWFIPAQVSPFKHHSPPTPIEHRLSMVRLAIREVSQFYVKELERERPPPSYTIDTLRIFIERELNNPLPNRFYLLMGEDALPAFSRWRLPEEIVRLVPLLIGSRSGLWQHEWMQVSVEVQEAIQAGLTTTRLMDVSSTDLRLRLAKGAYCGHLLASSVLQYIRDHGLYTTPHFCCSSDSA